MEDLTLTFYQKRLLYATFFDMLKAHFNYVGKEQNELSEY